MPSYFQVPVDLMYLKDSTYDITQDVVNGLNRSRRCIRRRNKTSIIFIIFIPL
jgi:hypothetical protein